MMISNEKNDSIPRNQLIDSIYSSNSVVIEKARLEYLCERAKIIDSYDSGVSTGKQESI